MPRVGDSLIVPISLWTLSSLAKIDSIEFLPLSMGSPIEIPLSQHMVKHDPMRICELETMANWGPTQSEAIFQIVGDSQLATHFRLRSLFTSGYDIVHIKAVFEAETEGS